MKKDPSYCTLTVNIEKTAVLYLSDLIPLSRERAPHVLSVVVFSFSFAKPLHHTTSLASSYSRAIGSRNLGMVAILMMHKYNHKTDTLEWKYTLVHSPKVKLCFRFSCWLFRVFFGHRSVLEWFFVLM